MLEIPVWNAGVIVGCGKLEGQFTRLLKKWIHEDDVNGYLKVCRGPGVRGCVHRAEEGAIHALWIPKIPNNPEATGHFVHEVGHVAFAILRNKGLWHTTSSEESYTYLMGYLTEQILTKLKKR